MAKAIFSMPVFTAGFAGRLPSRETHIAAACVKHPAAANGNTVVVRAAGPTAAAVHAQKNRLRVF